MSKLGSVLGTAMLLANGGSAPAGALKPLESGHAPVHGIEMYYEVHGRRDGIPLVLLHGGGSTIEVTFSRVLPVFAASRRVIAVEEQGHGRTTDRDQPVAFETSADDVAALLRHLKIDQADLFGFSNGMSFNTVSDFRNNVQQRLHVDRYVLDGDVGDLAAPAAVRSAPEPAPAYTVDATVVAPGVWLLSGNGGANSVLLEFADHLTLFEVPTSRAWTAALIAKARSTVPGKPVTEAITSHHHFDHTGGLRTAIAEGLTIVTQTGNVAWFEELARRRVEAFPDALSRNPKPIKTRAVDDHLRLSDSKLTVDVYRVVSNNHMAHGLMAYVPEHRLLIQGDLFDLNWEVYFWGNTYEDNVAYRKLEVERDVPIHGRVLPLSEVRMKLAEQTRNAAQLCARVETAGLSMPGCPLAWED